ncbi:FAD-dependent oxidoreductase, partial [Reticulomyxa filosa]
KSGVLAVGAPECQESLLRGFSPHHSEITDTKGKKAKRSYEHLEKKRREKIEVISKQQASQIYPWLKWDTLAELSVWEPGATDLDIRFEIAIHTYTQKSGSPVLLAWLQARGVSVKCDEPVTQIKKDTHNGLWEVVTKAETQYKCRLIVNAAGAWADSVAQMANLRPLNIVPLRRSIIIFPPQFQTGSPYNALDMTKTLKDPNRSLPWIFGADENEKEFWYLAPQAKSGLFLASPANRDLDDPCDAACTDFDVALCVDRVQS